MINDNDIEIFNIPVAGKMDPEALIKVLAEIGEEVEPAGAADGKELIGRKDFALNLFAKRAWMHTAHTFGYLAPTGPVNGQTQSISHAGDITADPTLKNTRIKITLDRLRVADYPGRGKHSILFDFYAENQLENAREPLHFSNTYSAMEGEQAALIGYPIFIGLNVGKDGISFRCFTVNVKNDSDEQFLKFLDSDEFKAGLQLTEKLQPAIAPLSKMALGISQAIAKRNRNIPVQNFNMGLDFSNIATRARLREGSYIAVQIPESISVIWDWDEWVFNPKNGQIVNRDDMTQLVPYNYIVFSISRYEGA